MTSKGLLSDGVTAATKVPIPIFTSESAEKLVQEVLEPLFNFKKHATLTAVKDMPMSVIHSCHCFYALVHYKQEATALGLTLHCGDGRGRGLVIIH